MEIKAVYEKMLPRFRELFGEGEPTLYFAPGRVNLIGEHTDYNGGHVLPCAISLGIWALAVRREGNRVRVGSMNFDDRPPTETGRSGIELRVEWGWANYPLGMLSTLEAHRYPIPSGLDILFWGELPVGAGLSSSAALEVLTACVVNDLFGLRIDRLNMAIMGQETENRFIGTQCGIMDQFAVSMGRKGCAVLLNCAALTHLYAPLYITGYQIVIADTNRRQSAGREDYNLRCRQCEAACEAIRRVRPIRTLCELSVEDFNRLESEIPDPVNLRRARHAVTENQRTLDAARALSLADLRTFGLLMRASHLSLRDDYEVTCPELDALAELAWRQPGVIGARMTGAGFGGCTVNVVERHLVSRFIRDVGAGYELQMGCAPRFYVADAADGAAKVRLPK